MNTTEKLNSIELFPRNNPTLFSPLSKGNCLFFLKISLLEATYKKEDNVVPSLEDNEKNLCIQIIEKRITAFNLPIKFTPMAFLAITIFANNPGRAVALLIDCLTMFEGKTVDIEMLTQVYPLGFYTEETFTKYVDEYLKTRKVKWSEIY